MKFDNVQFAREWFDSAKEVSKHSKDPVMQDIMRFFCAYVAFDSLYSPYKDGPRHERTAIRKFITVALQQIRDETGKNYSLREAYETIPDFQRKICNGVKEYDPEDKDWNEVEHYTTDTSVKRMFQNIYTIRKNLFHGMKAPHSNDDDREFVKEGSYILFHFLTKYLSLDDKVLQVWSY